MLGAGFVPPLLLNSEPGYGITLIGPMRPNVSWQANSDGYDLRMFRIKGEPLPKLRVSRFAALAPA